MEQLPGLLYLIITYCGEGQDTIAAQQKYCAGGTCAHVDESVRQASANAWRASVLKCVCVCVCVCVLYIAHLAQALKLFGIVRVF
jgi:hypothetical protein